MFLWLMKNLHAYVPVEFISVEIVMSVHNACGGTTSHRINTFCKLIFLLCLKVLRLGFEFLGLQKTWLLLQQGSSKHSSPERTNNQSVKTGDGMEVFLKHSSSNN